MKNFFAIGEAAKECGMTAETLRHYDRIGLVSPGEKDKFTGYRYYSADDIVRLKTIKMLKVMAIPLDEIKRLLELDDLQKVVEAFSRFEYDVQVKIQQLNEGLEYMRRVREVYKNLEEESAERIGKNIYLRRFSTRRVFAAPPDEKLCAANLWRYHDLFYKLLGDRANLFTFTDKAAVYTVDGESRLIAECVKYDESDERVIVLPSGNYACGVGDDISKVLRDIESYAKSLGKDISDWNVAEIVITGILSWSYCVQVLLT